MSNWLARVHHDLVKRLLWPARDRRDLGGKVLANELVVALEDDDGRSITARALWQKLATAAPPTLPAPAQVAFGAAIARAEAAARRGDLDGVLALEADYANLARAMNQAGGGSTR